MKKQGKVAVMGVAFLIVFSFAPLEVQAGAGQQGGNACNSDADCSPGQVCVGNTCQGGGSVPELPGGSLYAVLAGASGGLYWIRRFFKR